MFDTKSREILHSTLEKNIELEQAVAMLKKEIATRKKQEAIIKNKEEQYRTLAQNADIPIYRYDKDFKRLFVNSSVEKLTGRDASEFLGKTPLESGMIEPSYNDALMNSLKKVLRSKKQDSVELLFILPNGTKKYFNHNHVPEFDDKGNVESILAVGRDITAQKELALKEEKFRTLSENSPNIIMRYDKECNRIYANPAFAEQTGIPYDLTTGNKPETQWGVYLDMLNMTAEEYQNRVQKVIQTGVNDNLTTEWIRKKDRTQVAHDIHLVAEKNGNGEIIGALAIGHEITKLKEANEQLLLQKFALDHVHDGIYFVNQDSSFTYVNKGACKALGYAQEELLQLCVNDIDPSDWSQKNWNLHWQELKTKQHLTIETAHKRKDGTIFPVELDLSYVVYNGVEYNIAIARDITERKTQEELVRKSEQEFRTLTNNIPNPILRFDRECRRTYVNAAVERISGIPASELIASPVTDTKLISSHEAPIAKEAIQKVFDTKESVSKEFLHTTIEGEKLYFHILYVPEFGADEEVESVVAIAHDITAVKKQQELFEALQESEQKFRTLIENATDHIVRYDKEARITYMNPQVEKVIGVSSELVLGKTPTQNITNDLYAKYEIELKKVIATGENAHTFITFPDIGDGEQYHYINIVAERDIDDNIIGVVVFGRDVTELTQKTIELQKSLEFNEGVIAAIPDLLFEIAPDGTYIGVWAQNPELLATQKEMLIGNNFKEILPSDVVVSLSQTLKEVDEKGSSLGNTYSLDFPEGKRWFELSAAKKKSSGNYMILSRDITERKHIEESLREAQHIAHVGSWDVDIVNNKLTWSDETYRIWEIDKEDFEATVEAFLETVHPEDREMVAKNYNDAIVNHSNYNIEHRLLFSDGRIKYIHERGEPHYDENDEPIRFIGTAVDITERKVQENALVQKEQQFRTLAEHTPDTIARYDKECKRTYANPSLCKLAGKTKDELLGKTPTFYMNTAQAKEYEKVLKEVFQNGIESDFELSWKNTKDEIITSLIHIVPEYNNNGDIVSVLATGRDITKLKEYENELLKQKDFQETLLRGVAEAELGLHVIEDGKYIYTNNEKLTTQYYGSLTASDRPSFLDIIHPDDRERVMLIHQKRLAGEDVPTTHNVNLITQKGEEREHEVSVVMIPNTNPIQSILITKDITERKNIEKRIEFMAHHDILTALPNRLLAKDRAEQMFARAKRLDKKAAVLFIDLDGFKTINDSLGHSVGDEIIKKTAARLQSCIRGSDTISRQGGDEFIVILPDLNNKHEALKKCEKLLGQFKVPFEVSNNMISLSASIGISIYPDHGETFEVLLQSADAAMYKAKEDGKNDYCIFNKKMKSNLLELLKIQNDLQVAIENKEFILHYQPQVDITNNKIIGVETLIRWEHPTLGMVPPMNFISIAESTGLIIPIGEWVLKEACSQASLWHKQGKTILVAVNISAIQFKKANIIKVIKEALEVSGLDPRYLELELTESILIHDTENVLQIVKEIKELGVQLSIDDFGTGYSSLAYLKKFAVDKLKIDQSFVKEVLVDNEDASIVRTIIQMAKSFNLRSIAEGVENQEVLDLIKEFGCDEVQGYHFAKPMKAKDFEQYYENSFI